MDNYLSSRWPEGMATRPEPETKQTKKRERKKGRRVWRTILILAVTLVLLAGSGEVLWKGHPNDAAELEQVIEGELARR